MSLLTAVCTFRIKDELKTCADMSEYMSRLFPRMEDSDAGNGGVANNAASQRVLLVLFSS